MALQMNIPLSGGIEHADGYVRVTDCQVSKNDEESDWSMQINVAVYKDADARGAASPVRILAPDVSQFTFAHAVDDGVSPAAAYAKLKTHDTFKDKTTDV